jgi:DNA polymerase I-like protein with 3'-5' exonuclease and polymerase domains
MVDYDELPQAVGYITDTWTSVMTSQVLRQAEVSIDIETKGVDKYDALRWWAGEIRLVQLGFRDGFTFVVDLDRIFNKEDFFECLRKLFENEKIIKLGHNLKFDISFLLHHAKLRGIYRIRDTMVTSMMVHLGVMKNGKQPISHNLLSCVQRQLGQEIDKTEQKSDFGNTNLSLNQIEYAAKDTQILFPLWDSLAQRVAGLGMQKVVAVENEVVAVFARIQVNGVGVDLDRLKVSKGWYLSQIEKHAKVYQQDFPGQKYSGSTQAKVVEQKLTEAGFDLNNAHRTDGGDLKVDAAFLETEIGQALSGLRALNEIRSLNKHIDYIDGMLENQRDGRVFTCYSSLTATSLGRSTSGKFTKSKLAYDGINLQNVPGKYDKSDEAKEHQIKKCFPISVVADLSAAHSKIAVEVTQDKLSIDIERAGGDIHLFTAVTVEQMSGGCLTFDEMMVIKKKPTHPQFDYVDKLRSIAKETRYSSFNLGGSARLQQTLQKKGVACTLDECKESIKAWRINHKPIYDYQVRVIKEANKHNITFPDSPFTYGKTVNHIGSVLFMPKQVSQFSKEGKPEVKAADCCSHKWMAVESHIMKSAMIRIQKQFDANPKWSAKLVNIIHDELNAECHPDYKLDVAKVVFHGMDDEMKRIVKSIPTTQDTADKCIVSSWADK